MCIDDEIRQELKRMRVKICYELSSPISINSEIAIGTFYHYSCTLKQDDNEIQIPYVYLSDDVLNKILDYLKTK